MLDTEKVVRKVGRPKKILLKKSPEVAPDESSQAPEDLPYTVDDDADDDDMYDAAEIEAAESVDISPVVIPAGKRKKTTDKAGELKSSIGRFLLATVREQQRKEGIMTAAIGGESGQQMLGLKCPLAFQYLIQNDHLPLGLFIHVVGTQGTMKSGLVAEMGRWFAKAGGYLSLVENESKFSPDWFDSIIGYPDETGEQVMKIRRAKSTNDWQTILQEEIELAKRLMSHGLPKQGIQATGATFPVLFAVDSIMGKLSRESQDRIEKAGFADRAHPHEALQITQFLKKIPQDICDWPMCLVGVNHLKPKKAEHGFHTERSIGGGWQVKFQESLELQMGADKTPDFTLASNDPTILETRGKHLTINCYKNAIGETRRTAVKIAILWQYKVGADGNVRQYTRWDWHAAIIDLLLGYKEGRAKKISDVVDIMPVTGGRFWSKALGIAKSDAVSKTELGKKLEANPDIIKTLTQLLAIKTVTPFKVGGDFHEQLKEHQAENEKRMNNL